MIFKNREHAAYLLASKLKQFKGQKDVIVVAIPRGGVVLGKIIAEELRVQLQIIVVKKIGAPQNSELAIGAVCSEGIVYWDYPLIKKLGLKKSELAILKDKKEDEVRKREILFGQAKLVSNIYNKTVIVVDDGVATGATTICTSIFLKKGGAKKIVLAIPVIAKDTFNTISKYFDIIITLEKVEQLYAVSQFYEDFPQVSNEKVLELLKNSSVRTRLMERFKEDITL